jgi:catechol 2,3-dioxygenase-like lactoylglutathione lyase family enzyme
MERFIADLVKQLEGGAIDRREFCQTVALAAAVYAAGDAAQAQTGTGFKVLGINHLSYSCPDYTKARDFYVNVFGLENAPGKDTGKRANLMFGPSPGKGGSFIVARNATPSDRPAARAVVDHICFTLSNWNEQRVREAMKAKGQTISGGRDGSLHVLDPFNYDVQFANIVEENAFRRGQ